MARQEQDARALAESRGWEVVDVYCDNDTSASSYGKKPRTQYLRMLADIESGRINAVAVWALDRLYRKPIDLERLIPLVEERGVLMATVGGDHDLSTRGGLLHARIMGAVAADESRAKSDRQVRSNIQRRERGLSHGGPRAYGFVSNGTMEPAPAEIAVVPGAVCQVQRRVIVAGAGARPQHPRGAHGAGREWIDSTVRAILLNARYVGLIEHDGETGAGSWEPVVSEDAWRAARAKLTDPARRTSPGSGRKYLLSRRAYLRGLRWPGLRPAHEHEGAGQGVHGGEVHLFLQARHVRHSGPGQGGRLRRDRRGDPAGSPGRGGAVDRRGPRRHRPAAGRG